MREVPESMDLGWNAEYKGGVYRPRVRATVQKLNMTKVAYDMNRHRDSHTLDGPGVFTSAIFGQQSKPVEIPNVVSVNWSKATDQDVAEMTMVVWNTKSYAVGETVDSDEDGHFDVPGYMTFSRGKSAESQSRWGQAKNEWFNRLVPDAVIRTYEGYGYDPESIPEEDAFSVQSGMWRIDDVTFDSKGTITIKARDIASLLIDHVLLPPVCPWSMYPLEWIPVHNVDNPDTVKFATGSKWFRPTYDTDSNKPYIGKGLKDGSRPYVDSTGGVMGHKGSHAVDSSTSSYWLSVGNYPAWSSAYEYVQGKFSARSISAIKVKTYGGPYTCYVSVKVGGSWVGAHKIPYSSQLVDTNADIKFVKKKRVSKNSTTTIALDKEYNNATAVRLTFTDLYDTGIGRYRWRAGVKDLQVLQGTKTSTTIDGGTHIEGNVWDYSDIVKWCAGWGGFYWPKTSTGKATIKNSDGAVLTVSPGSNDIVLPGGGRIWGDFMDTGTKPRVDIGTDVTHWATIMDVIRNIKDIVGFSFFCDETGGLVWRLQNLFKTGNYLSGADGGPNEGYTTDDFVEIDEHQQLMDMNVTISGRNIRERNVITSTDGKTGAASSGYNPGWSTGLRRIGGWTDQHFETTEECEVMADLIAIRQMMTMRKNTTVIPGYPKIQLDDQVKIFERTTSEVYVHYVKGIQCEINNDTGVYKYTIDTHWLGENASQGKIGGWHMDKSKLAAETQRYLKRLGAM